jgi:hypothetical protein
MKDTINNITLQLDMMVNNITHNININNTETILLGGKLYGAQINRITSGNDKEFVTASDNNMLSKVDINTCITIIRNKLHISDDFDFYVSKVDMDSALDLDTLIYPATTKVVKLNLYTGDSKQKIDLSICNNVQNTFDIPILNANKLNLDKYRYYKADSIDIYNPASLPFTTRCFSSSDRESGFDSTINLRRTHYYQNVSAICKNDCIYNGINNDYLQCLCSGIPGEILALFNNEHLGALSTTNQDILECLLYAFNVLIF